MSGDPYIDPETGVLRNRLGITDAVELAQAEAELTSYRLIELRRTDLPGRYDLPHLQGFHRYIFGDLYDWAGELRSVSIGKSDLFCLPQYLGSFAEDVFGKLAWAGYLRGLERVAFVDGLTMLLADVNALHPFREGNGRTQRAFLAQLARDAGHPIHWAGMDPTVNVAASQAAHRGNNAPLRAMLNELVDDTVDRRDVLGERAPVSAAPTVARGFEAPAPRMPVSTVASSGSPFSSSETDEVRRSLVRLGETVGQVLDETGLSEEKLAQMFDLRRRHAE